MKITFQNPTKGPLITVTLDDETAMVSRAFSLIGASRVVAAASDGLATLRTAAQFAKAAPGAAGGGAELITVAGPAILVGAFLSAGDSSSHSHTPEPKTNIVDRPNSDTSVPQWLEDMAEKAKLYQDISRIEQQIFLLKKWGLGHLIFLLQTTLDNLNIHARSIAQQYPPSHTYFRATASANTSVAPTNTNTTQVEKNVRHAEPLESFTPSRRAVLLVNLGDNNNPTYSWNPLQGQDSHLAEIEIALTGQFQGTDRLHQLDAEHKSLAQEELKKTAGIFDIWAERLASDLSRRSTLPVDQVIRIFPDQDLEAAWIRAMRDLNTGDPQQLTYVAIVAHGVDNEDPAFSHNALSIDGKIFPFSELIKFLDTIPGKKVVILSSCYSGSFVDHVAAHSRSTDYAVIADTSPDEVSVGINQLTFMHELVVNIIDERPLSHIRWDTRSLFGHKQTPSIFVGFDTVF